MDEDQIELVRQLCTQVGMIMEDTSAIALRNNPADNLTERAEILLRELDRAIALAAAARALCSVRQP